MNRITKDGHPDRDTLNNDLQSAHTLLHLAFDHSVQANFVTLTGDEKVIIANQAACKLLGYSRKELLTKKRNDIFDINPPFIQMVRERAASGHCTALITLRKKSGGLLPCEITSAVFTDESGIEKAVYAIGQVAPVGDASVQQALFTKKDTSVSGVVPGHPGTRLLLADDHIIITTGLKLFLKEFMPDAIIEETHDGEATIEKIKSDDYDLLVLDVNMPGTEPFTLVSTILALQPKMKILMFSMSDEAVYARRYLQMGVMGYLQKDEPVEEIRTAIAAVLSNQKYTSPALSRVLLRDSRSNRGENVFDRLSPRELEIALHLMHGDSAVMICQKLSLHPSTVSTVKSRIFKKLGCSNIIGLARLAKIHNI